MPETLTVHQADGRTLWQTGGRKTTDYDTKAGTAQVTIMGGRLARRLDEHHAVLVCGECHQKAHIERGDGEPLSDEDITRELAGGIVHECTRQEQS